jgi:membrane protease YdiL (CAAX protease family)
MISAAPYILISTVVFILPVRGWFRLKRQQTTRPLQYIAETAVLTLFLVYILISQRVSPSSLGLFPPSRTFLMHLVACTIITIGIDVCVIVFVGVYAKNHCPPVLPQTSLSYAWAVPVCLTGAVWEELFFRGYVHHIAELNMSLLPAFVMISCIVFGLQHLSRGATGATYSFAYGLLFFCMYLISRDLSAVIIAHAAGNLFTIFCGANWIARLTKPSRAAEFDVRVIG